jgi:hypothetical protein
LRLDKNSYEILLDAYSPYIMFFGEDGDIYSYVHHARETTRICFPENDQPAFTQKWNGLTGRRRLKQWHETVALMWSNWARSGAVLEP